MKNIILVLALVFIAGCTKDEPKKDPFKSIACGIGKSIGLGISGAVANKLECSKPEAIQTKLVEILEKAKICETPEMKGVALFSASPQGGNFMCQTIGSMFLNGLVQGAIPADWGCNPAKSAAEIEKVLSEVCSKI